MATKTAKIMTANEIPQDATQAVCGCGMRMMNKFKAGEARDWAFQHVADSHDGQVLLTTFRIFSPTRTKA